MAKLSDAFVKRVGEQIQDVSISIFLRDVLNNNHYAVIAVDSKGNFRERNVFVFDQWDAVRYHLDHNNGGFIVFHNEYLDKEGPGFLAIHSSSPFKVETTMTIGLFVKSLN